MTTKMRMQVGATLVSWGARAEQPVANVDNTKRRARPKFIVIEGGRNPPSRSSQRSRHFAHPPLNLPYQLTRRGGCHGAH